MVKLHATYAGIAKMMSIILGIFPCLSCGGEVHIQDRLSSLPRSYACESLPDKEKGNYTEENTLRCIPFSENAEGLPSNIITEAHQLTEDFLDKKARRGLYSGYHVYLRPNASQTSLELTILPRGIRGKDIEIPALVSRCTCCKTVFEHSFKERGNALLDRISEEIAVYNMIPVLSQSNNLLLVPDTRKADIRPEDFPHLFYLDPAQLEQVFAAALITDRLLRSLFSDYKTQIGFHVGVAGSQTIGVLHTRFEGLSKEAIAALQSSKP